MIMKNVKNYLFIASMLVAGIGVYYWGHQKGFRKGNNNLVGKLHSFLISNTSTDTNSDQSHVPLSTDVAIERIKNYGHWMGEVTFEAGNKDSDPSKFISGWEIPITNVLEYIKSLDTHKIEVTRLRAYLSFHDPLECNKDSIIENIEKGTKKAHLILVPITTHSPSTSEIVTVRAFNLIRPCPQNCDLESSFYKAYADGFNEARREKKSIK
jgi:hypothetical protein